MTMAVFSPIDLHSHSTASDGDLAPADLVAAAAAAGVAALALTDHDSVDGLDAANRAAVRHGVRLVPGVEISVTWDRRTLHVLGLGIDPAAAPLIEGLGELQLRRRVRAEAIAAKVQRLGVERPLEQVETMAAGGQITRSHFARLLVDAGICKDAKRAFKRFLAQGRPAYVSGEWAHLGSAIEWIHNAGGRAVLAHPFKYPMNRSARQRMLGAFRSAGGDGVEVSCGTSEPADIVAAAQEAAAHGLAGSLGSDFHGAHQPWIRLGRIAPLPPDLPSICAALQLVT